MTVEPINLHPSLNARELSLIMLGETVYGDARGRVICHSSEMAYASVLDKSDIILIRGDDKIYTMMDDLSDEPLLTLLGEDFAEGEAAVGNMSRCYKFLFSYFTDNMVAYEHDQWDDVHAVGNICDLSGGVGKAFLLALTWAFAGTFKPALISQILAHLISGLDQDVFDEEYLTNMIAMYPDLSRYSNRRRPGRITSGIQLYGLSGYTNCVHAGEQLAGDEMVMGVMVRKVSQALALPNDKAV